MREEKSSVVQESRTNVGLLKQYAEILSWSTKSAFIISHRAAGWMNEWPATWNHHDDWRDMFQIYLINKSAYPSSRKAKEPKVKLILFVKGFQKCEPEKLLMGFKSLYWVTSKLFPCPPNPSLFALKLSVNSGKSSARALHFLQSVFTCFVIDTRKGLLFPQRTGHPGTLTLPWWNA